jgi:hypothetical protein
MSLIYLIESGKPLQLIQRHIEELKRVRTQNQVIAEELGVREASTDRFTGVLVGVVFPRGKTPEGWTKPDRKHGVSFPKKGSPMAARFAAQVGFESPATTISNELGVPCDASFETDGGGYGSTYLGDSPFRPCGWLYCSEFGPFALFTPAVVAEGREMTEAGKKVTGAAATYQGVIEGCRQIDEEEWDLITAQHALDMKRKKAQVEAQKGGAA